MKNNLRQDFFDFFAEKNHIIIPSSPLIPQDDPSILFVNAGMAPLKNYFLNPSSLKYDTKNLASIQKCLRAGGKHNDLDEVGYTKRHHTFFEMCGNFSFGGYSNEEAINLAWDFLTKKIGLPKDRLYITVHPMDAKSLAIWKTIVQENRIRFTEENEWSMGDSGPCGMCTEIFFDHGGDEPEEDRVVEIWNIVFMTHQVNAGIKTELDKTCIDTGMGLERLNAILSHTNDNYKSPLFHDLIKLIEIETQIEESASHRILADHSRSILFMITDGILPDTGGRGYVLRRILRRAIRHEEKLGKENLIEMSIKYMIQKMSDAYPEVEKNKSIVFNTLRDEIGQFRQTLVRGIYYLDKFTKGVHKVDGETMFRLYDTYGLPVEIIKDTFRERDIEYNIDEFEQVAEKNRASSKKDLKTISNFAASTFVGYSRTNCNSKVTYLKSEEEYTEVGTEETVFYPKGGGQESDRGMIFGDGWAAEVLDVQKSVNSIVHYCKLKHGMPKVNDSCFMEIDINRRICLSQHHSATHLLVAALRKFLGNSVEQKGSLVQENRLRFDFLYNRPVENISEIEKQVNTWIQDSNATNISEMSKDDATKIGALATFGERYGDTVRVVTIGDSMELCGGTHVENSASIGSFYILSERSISSNVRRIEAVAGIAAYDYARSKLNLLSSLSKAAGVNDLELQAYISKKQKPADKNTNQNEVYLAQNGSEGGVTYAYVFLKNASRSIALKEIEKVKADLILIANRLEDKTVISIKSLCSKTAKDIIATIFSKFSARSGGGKDFAEGGLPVGISDEEIIKAFIGAIGFLE